MKPYRDYNSYLREIFGERVQKISLDAGLSCPNRDGSISHKGCIFCDSRGSGTGAMTDHGLSIDEQIIRGKRFAEKRYKAKKFIVYFQSFSNTYASPPKLRTLYDQALNHENVVGISIGTRPDCIGYEILDVIDKYKSTHLVWIELGLQSAHDITLQRINRGHDLACFEKSVRMAGRYSFNICAHVILGLPGETPDMMMDTAKYLSGLPVSGVKIHLLYIVKNTGMADLYDNKEYICLERDEYIDRVVDFVELLPPEVVIHRLTGDPPPSELIAPLWAAEKSENLNRIIGRFEERNTWQGKRYQKSSAGK